MPRTQSCRKYQLTINNPVDHRLTHDVLKTTLAGMPSCYYWCMCDEIGEQGTPHTHLYLSCYNPVEFTAIQKRFYGAHIERAYGSHKENRDYIRKEGKWKDDAKHETNLIETFEESGDLPPETTASQKQSEQILQLVRDGATNAEIVREIPSSYTKLRQIDFARQSLLEEQFGDDWRQLSVTYLFGKTAVGKTRSVMEKYGYKNVYRVTNYKNPFDSYQGQKVLAFEEFRSSLPIADMLKYLDGYPVMLPCRFADKVACFDTVFVISNIPFEKQYIEIQQDEPETFLAFRRRFTAFTEMRCEDV